MHRTRLFCQHNIICTVVLMTTLYATPVHTDGRWTFENDALQVRVHEEAGTWDVLDKRCDRLWRQAEEPRREQLVLPVCRVGSAPVLDGQLAEWAGQGVPVNSKVSYISGEADEPDCSARFHLAWDADGFWLAADVTDDTRSGIVPEAKLWHVDSIELWLGEEHWGLAPDGDRVTIECWSDPKMAEGCRAETRATETGWTLEAFVPWNRIAALEGKAEKGRQVLLAFGVNDSDGGPKRQCQLFYPAGYKHKTFHTHSVAELVEAGADTTPRTQLSARTGPVVTRITPLPAPTEGVAIDYSCSGKGGTRVPVTARVWLQPGTGDIGYELSGDLDVTFEELTLPAPFILEADAGKLVIPQMAGLLYGVDELSWDHGHLGGNISMPWFGMTDLATGQGYAAIFEVFDDAKFRGAKVAGEKGDVLSVQPVFLPQKGTLGYARRMIYHFADTGGYVAMAKRYRAYVKKTGLLKTLAEKRRERPNIDKVVGAVNIYCSHFSNIEEIRDMGVERAMISGFSGDRVRQMNEWGYLPGRYDIYTDLYEPDTHCGKWERCQGFTFPDDVIKKANGENQVGWCWGTDPKTGKKSITPYVICWTCGLRTLKEKMPKRLAASLYTSYFLDCTTSVRLYECYDPNHPLTRTQDREARVAQFGYLSDGLGLIVGSESGRDWGAREADYFEGIMSTSSFFANPKSIHAMPFESCESTPRYEEYATNPQRRVPLFQLVYGDCTETTWRWGDNNHRMPKLWARKDLIQIVHATMPTWVLWDVQQSLFWNNTERFKECYDNVCGWRRAVGYSEMTNHERFGDDAMVQRSTFANGAAVTVNFATETRIVDGVSLPPCSYLITGDAPGLAGLPVGKPVQVSYKWEAKEPELTGNTGFERRPLLWTGRGLSLEIQEDVVHSGRHAARLSGTTEAGGYSYASTVKVPLEAGARYRVSGWVRVDALDPADKAPALKCGIDSDKGWLTNMYTPAYDLSKLGTWQKLEKTFTAPEGGVKGGMSLEKRTKDAVTATLYLDDVELIRIE